MSRCRSPLRLLLVALVSSIAAASASGQTRAPIVGSVITYTAVRGDTLKTIAARFGIYPSTIAADNEIDQQHPLQPGRELKIDNRHLVPGGVVRTPLVVNIPQRMVFFDDGTRILAYPIAVGRPTWQTPTGSFTVSVKRQDPSWHPPQSIRAESARSGHVLPLVVPPGPRNPLGRFWLGLSVSGIGIHGTVAESSIYSTTTHGCIRLQREPIANLFASVPLGTPGEIVYEPVLLAIVDGDVMIEVHPDIYRRLPHTAGDEARRLAAHAGVEDRIDWVFVDREIEGQAGIARRVSIGH